MTPYVLAVFLLGLAPLGHDRRWHHAIALAGLVFCAARFGTQAWSYHELEQDQRRQLSALDHIDRGARVLVLVNTPCDEPWSSPRTEHLGSMAIVRRDAYANGMWPMPGGRLVTNIYAAAGPFAYSPSQVLRPARCRAWDNPDPAQALGLTKSGAFDYLWLIDTPNRRGPALPWLRRVWSGPMGGVLYRIDNSTLTLYAHKS
jgi:hypothetical protein